MTTSPTPVAVALALVREGRHLGAVLEGRTCGCGDLPATVADASRAFVLTRLPADLLARPDAAITDGDFQINVELRREPTQAELAGLDSVFRSAQAEFRRRLSEPRYSGRPRHVSVPARRPAPGAVL